MSTTLPQRLRAARQFADLRQQDIAEACALAGIKVSRSAVAQWEYDDERRTQPSIEHVKVVAKRTGVPLDWLLNDAAEIADIWRAGKLAEPAPMPLTTPTPPGADRLSEACAKAIEFAVLSRRPDLAAGFGLSVVQSGIAIRPDFSWGNVIAEFKMSRPGPDAIGQLLMAEQALARRAKKVIIQLDPGADTVEEIFGVTVYHVSSPEKAADTLLSLIE